MVPVQEKVPYSQGYPILPPTQNPIFFTEDTSSSRFNVRNISTQRFDIRNISTQRFDNLNIYTQRLDIRNLSTQDLSSDGDQKDEKGEDPGESEDTPHVDSMRLLQEDLLGGEEQASLWQPRYPPPATCPETPGKPGKAPGLGQVRIGLVEKP